MATNWSLNVGGGAQAGDAAPGGRSGKAGRVPTGRAGGDIGISSTESGQTSSSASASMDIVNYDVREAIAAAERAATRSNDPGKTFSDELSRQILGPKGLRNRYLENADSGRGTFDYAAPLTSWEQSSVLSRGRFTTDRDQSGGDGDPTFKTRKD